jgi:cell division protease FtsH
MDGKEFYEIVKGEQHCAELTESAGKKAASDEKKSEESEKPIEKKTRTRRTKKTEE